MGLMDLLGGAGGGDAGGQQGPAGAVMQMLQSQPGGLQGVMEKLQGAGLGGAAQSWLGDGQNQSVSPDQVQSALGPDAVGQVAGQLGTGQGEAAGHIAQFLPMIMDHLGSGGQLPAGGGIGELHGLLSKFGGSVGALAPAAAVSWRDGGGRSQGSAARHLFEACGAHPVQTAGESVRNLGAVSRVGRVRDSGLRHD